MEQNSMLARIELSLERKIYERSFYEFYKAAFCQLHPGLAYDENWHAKYICDILQKETERVIAKLPREKDLIINVPPRSSKSMIVTVIWPVWSWTKDPTLKFLRCSYSDTIATILSRQSKDLILTNWFQRLYGSKIKLRGDLSGAGHFGNVKTGFMYAFGLDGTVTGVGGDFIIADDPQNPKKANSEVERESAIERWNGTVSNRLNQLEIGGRIIVMQRLHQRDLVGYLLDPKSGRPEDFIHVCIPAEYDANLVKPIELKQFYTDGKYFWKSRFSEKVLSTERKKGTLYFSGQFQQTPVPPEGNLFKRAWIDIIPAENISRNASESPIHFFIDTAYTEDETERNDPSGIFTCFKKGDILYGVNFVEVWMEFPKLIAFIKEYVHQNGYSGYSAIYIEPKASGKSVVQQLRSESNLNVIEIEAEWIRDDKVTRATAVSPIVEGRRLKLIQGEKSDWIDKYIGQLTSFPKAQHDEAVDTTVYALNYLLPANDFDYMLI
jgi:predicted phage terminase large subunit-like protein